MKRRTNRTSTVGVADRLVPGQRTGFTLIELLVALTVITILAGIALPATKAMLQEQRVSRGATLLQSAIGEARARAISNGGGGLIIDRRGTLSVAQRSEAIQLRFATSPPLYRGEPEANLALLAARNTVSAGVPNRTAHRNIYCLWFPPTASLVRRSGQDFLAEKPRSLVNPGDLIALGVQGLPFRIATIEGYDNSNAGDAAAQQAATLDSLNPTVLPASQINRRWTRVTVTPVESNLNLNRFVSKFVEFAITRQPRVAIAQPINLPSGTSIDLTASGVGRSGNDFSPFEAGYPLLAGSTNNGPQINYVATDQPPFAVPADLRNPTPDVSANLFDYESIYVLFDSRGAVSRVLVGRPNTSPSAAAVRADPIVLTEVDVTGDVYFLINETGAVKTDPNEQFEDQEGRNVTPAADIDPMADNAEDGTTPVLNTESIWVVIRSRSGDVIASPWVNPTDDGRSLAPYYASLTTPTNAGWRTRIRSILSMTRSAAAELRDLGAE